MLAQRQLSCPAGEKEKSEEGRIDFHRLKRVKISSSCKGLTGDFILECRFVKVKCDSFEAETGGVEIVSWYTFMSILETLYCPQNCWNNCMIRHIYRIYDIALESKLVFVTHDTPMWCNKSWLWAKQQPHTVRKFITLCVSSHAMLYPIAILYAHIWKRPGNQENSYWIDDRTTEEAGIYNCI